MILSNQLRTTTNCAVLWFSDDTAGAKYSWIPSGGGEYGVQQTKHPELCLESESQMQGLKDQYVYVQICVLCSSFFLFFTSLVTFSSTCPLMSTEEIVFLSC